RALLASHENTADSRGDRGKNEGQRHIVGSDDGAEGVLLWHMGLPLVLPSGSARGRSSDLSGVHLNYRSGPCAGFAPASRFSPAGVLVTQRLVRGTSSCWSTTA